MMRIKKRSLRIFFAIAVLVLMSLACEWAVPTPILPSVTCTKRGSESAECTYVCKKGGGLLRDSFTPPYGNGGFANVEKEEELEKLCAASFPNDYSQPVSAASEATEPPTEAPTESPTETPTAAPIELPTPILTGDVTYCDAATRFINLRLVEGFSAESFNHQLSMGGAPMTCSFNQSNSTLLTCSYPATVSFPASIKVESSNGSVANEFEFTGSNCVVTQVGSGGDDVVCDPVIMEMDHVCVPIP